MNTIYYATQNLDRSVVFPGSSVFPQKDTRALMAVAAGMSDMPQFYTPGIDGLEDLDKAVRDTFAPTTTPSAAQPTAPRLRLYGHDIEDDEGFLDTGVPLIDEAGTQWDAEKVAAILPYGADLYFVTEGGRVMWLCDNLQKTSEAQLVEPGMHVPYEVNLIAVRVARNEDVDFVDLENVDQLVEIQVWTCGHRVGRFFMPDRQNEEGYEDYMFEADVANELEHYVASQGLDTSLEYEWRLGRVPS